MTEAEFKIKAESYWLKACAIADKYPDVDRSDVYNVLWFLELSPTERLKRGLMPGSTITVNSKKLDLLSVIIDPNSVKRNRDGDISPSL